jgi:hypothetical protein
MRVNLARCIGDFQMFSWRKFVALLNLERETGIEPATNGLGSRYSTIELLPLNKELYLYRALNVATQRIARFRIIATGARLINAY